MFKIPLFDINFDDNEKNAVNKTLDSKWISTGPKCNEFEKLFSEKLKTNYSLTTSSCTASLHMALVALGVNDGDEVLVPSLTFSATANVIKYVGAKPVFCDIKSLEDLTIDPNEIEKKILRNSFDGFMPDEILYRQKEALSNGVGHQWTDQLKNLIYNDHNMTEDEYYLHIYKNHNYHPNNIPYKWIPNKEWVTVPNNDSSATFLSCYKK